MTQPRGTRPTAPRAGSVALSLLMLIALMLAACGPGSQSVPTAGPGSSAGTGGTQMPAATTSY